MFGGDERLDRHSGVRPPPVPLRARPRHAGIHAHGCGGCSNAADLHQERERTRNDMNLMNSTSVICAQRPFSKRADHAPGRSGRKSGTWFWRSPRIRWTIVEGQSLAVLVPGPHEFGSAYHLRLYSIASPRSGEGGKADTFSICVRRCFYIDDVSGERYPGMLRTIFAT